MHRNYKHTAFRLPENAIKQADAIAAATESNRSQVVRQALSIGLRALAPTLDTEASKASRQDAA